MYPKIKIVHTLSNDLITRCPGLLTVSAKVVPTHSVQACEGVVLRYRSFFFKYGASWSLVVSFTPRPLYLRR